MAEFFELIAGGRDPEVKFNIERDEFYNQWWEQRGTPMLRNVFEKFGVGVLRRASILDGPNGLDGFLRKNNFSGKRCIEIGTAKGLTAIVLAQYFDEVVSIDIETDADKFLVADFCGFSNKIKFIDVTGNTAKKELISMLDFDAAYSDGNHAQDAEFDFNILRKCGRIVFHEYWPLQPPVWTLVNNLRRSPGNVEAEGLFALWTDKRG